MFMASGNIQYSKSLDLLLFRKVSLIRIQQKNFLVVVQNNFVKYFSIPNFVIVKIVDKTLLFSIFSIDNNYRIKLNSFFKLISSFYKFHESFAKKKLRLQGLGFRIALTSELNCLQLKLGFSHLFFMPFKIISLKISIQKNILFVEGPCKVEVGNFINKVRSLKIPDIYKGKGF
jgi:large subunit ribosomal protein L6